MVTGKTQSGFEFSVDPATVRDMEFLELVADASENQLYYGRLLTMLLGASQKKALYEHVRKDGHVDIADVDREVTEIFEIINTDDQTKN